MTSITKEQFDKQVNEQKENAIKWRELKEGQIYTILDVEFFTTQYGQACVLILSDNQKVFAPSSLTKRLEENKKPFPRYVRPTGKKQSKKNPAHNYYSFDLV